MHCSCQAAHLILAEVSHAYGLMILGEGLFQADGHPGNILVQRGGRVALLDYGQSKQLEESDKLAFADLILAMNRCGTAVVCGGLTTMSMLFTFHVFVIVTGRIEVAMDGTAVMGACDNNMCVFHGFHVVVSQDVAN